MRERNDACVMRSEKDEAEEPEYDPDDNEDEDAKEETDKQPAFAVLGDFRIVSAPVGDSGGDSSISWLT